jgi:hypothetical protein
VGIIDRPCYTTREQVARAADVKLSARSTDQVDRAIQTASENIDAHMHRQFYPLDTTRRYDWPNWQSAAPWRIWFDQNELADVTVKVPTVTSGGVAIPAANIFWGPWNYSPPFTFLELDRSSTSTFSQGATPQRSVVITGTFGYWLKTRPAGTLGAAISDTTGTTVTASTSTGALFGVGDLLLVDSERLLVTDAQFASTSISFTNGLGSSPPSAADNIISVPSGPAFAVNEEILIDAEWMLIQAISGNNLIVRRAWDGSVLATHSPGVISARRSLTVVRGATGTTAATHSNGAALSVFSVPRLIGDLALAEAAVQVLQETGGGENASNLGAGLADKWDEAKSAYRRGPRMRVI